MAGNLQPLVSNQRVANSDGTPTQYFIRWAQQKQIDIEAGITADQAQQLIDDWAAARKIIAGTGLSGGGYLSADVTLYLHALLSQLLDVDETTPPTNGQVLVFDGTEQKWKPGTPTSGSGALALIASQTLAAGASSCTFPSIPATYKDLVLIFSGGATAATPTIYMQANSDAGSNYDVGFWNHYGTGQTYGTFPATLAGIEGSTIRTGMQSAIRAEIIDYANTSFGKHAIIEHQYADNSNFFRNLLDWLWHGTTAINRLDFSLSAGAFTAGSRFSLYGRG